MTFDLDDTFYDNHPIIRRAEHQLFEYLFERYPATQQQGIQGWREIRRQVLSEKPQLAHDMIRLRKTILTRLFERAGIAHDKCGRAVEDAFTFFYQQRSDFQVAPHYCHLLEQLSKKIPLVAITNGNVDLQRIGIAPFFISSLHASIEQPMKPHRRMFDLAQASLAIPPQHILHVGDNLQKDVAGAIRAGFQAAWYADNREMRLANEKAELLPHAQLTDLSELLQLL